MYTAIQRFHNNNDNPFHDKRRTNGRSPQYRDLNQIVWQIRSEHPAGGPVMICHYLDKHRADFGLTELPSPSRIVLAIRELGTVPFALSIFERVVFIPPAQPWRNGRLERFHWTMEREYFARERPVRLADAMQGYVEYLNWYNRKRPRR